MEWSKLRKVFCTPYHPWEEKIVQMIIPLINSQSKVVGAEAAFVLSSGNEEILLLFLQPKPGAATPSAKPTFAHITIGDV